MTLKNYFYSISDWNINNKINLNIIFWNFEGLMSQYRGFAGGYSNAKSFEVNVGGRIAYDNIEKIIFITVGEVKLSLYERSMEIAQRQLRPVIFLLRYIIVKSGYFENIKFRLEGIVYYGRCEKEYYIDDYKEEDNKNGDIIWRFQNITTY